MQQGLDRSEIDRGGDRIEPGAEVAENRLEPARADLGVGEAIELAAEFAENRLEPAHAGVGVGEPIELDADFGRHRLEGATSASVRPAASSLASRSRMSFSIGPVSTGAARRASSD